MEYAKIKEIEIKNFRQFIHEVIKLQYSPGKNITIITGRNGYGKSNIFNAITWCFFEIEEHLSSESEGLRKCPNYVLYNLTPGKTVETEVKILIETNEGEINISRTMNTHKNMDGTVREEGPNLSIQQRPAMKRNWISNPYPDTVISHIISRDMRKFFFIDGEQLRQLFEETNRKELIKKSIFDLSQITLLQKTIDHLGIFKSTLRKGVKSPAGDDLRLCDQAIGDSNHYIERKKGELQKLYDDKSEAQANKNKLDVQLKDFNVEDIKAYAQKREDLEENIKSIESRISEEEDEYLAYLFGVDSGIIARKAIIKTKKILDGLESKGELPPKIQYVFVKELLKNGKCICGLDLKQAKNIKNREKIENLLKDVQISQVAQKATELKYQLGALLKDSDEFEEVYNKMTSKINELNKIYIEKQEELKAINTKIGNYPIEKIKKISEMRQQYTETILDCRGQIAAVNSKLKDAESKVKGLERQYRAFLGKEELYKDVLKDMNICDKGIEVLTGIKNKLMVEIKKEVEESTKKYFSGLITEKNFSKLYITNDYQIRIPVDDRNAVENLSAAETLCLGYSFMSALRKGSRFDAPIVIDTPLAKIDPEYRENVVNWFKKSLPDAQILLLVTKAEYTEAVASTFKSAVNNEYIIVYDGNKEISEIKNAN